MYDDQNILFSRSPPASFYLDMNWLGKYWNCYPGEGRVYHHTGPVNSVYALREALAILSEEGLIACYKRHCACTERLHDGLKAMGLELFVQNPDARLPTVTTIKASFENDFLKILQKLD